MRTSVTKNLKVQVKNLNSKDILKDDDNKMTLDEEIE